MSRVADKDVLIKAQAKRIRELKEDNKRLREDVKRLHGKLYKVRALTAK